MIDWPVRIASASDGFNDIVPLKDNEKVALAGQLFGESFLLSRYCLTSVNHHITEVSLVKTLTLHAKLKRS
jgi:hypothetical protein